MKTLLVYTFLLLFSFSICYLIYFLFKKLWRIKIPGIREKVVEEKEPKNRLHLNTKNFIKLFSISIFIATIIACITLVATVYNGGRIVNSINNDTIKVDTTTDTALTNGFKGLSRMEKIDILMDAKFGGEEEVTYMSSQKDLACITEFYNRPENVTYPAPTKIIKVPEK